MLASAGVKAKPSGRPAAGLDTGLVASHDYVNVAVVLKPAGGQHRDREAGRPTGKPDSRQYYPGLGLAEPTRSGTYLLVTAALVDQPTRSMASGSPNSPPSHSCVPSLS
jgi:hypothetical protein